MIDPRLRHSAAHVFVASVEAPVVEPADEHHIGRVLRVRPSDPVTFADGSGRWGIGRWTASTGLEVDAIVPAAAAWSGRPELVVATAIAKGDRPELVVQKLTELGIDRIVLFDAARAVVRWDAAKRDAQVGRLSRIAREAAMQSRRLRVPVVEHRRLDEVAAIDGVVAADPAGADDWWRAAETTVQAIVVGPEGGFTDEELTLFPDRVSLGPTVLRVETAAIVAAALLGLGRVSPPGGGG